MKTVLKVEGVCMRYGDTEVLHDFSLEIEKGYIYGLLGPNGSGKTTALHVISGLIKPTVGKVKIHGIDISDKISRQHIGFAPDDLPLPFALTGNEYLNFHHSMRGQNNTKAAHILAEAFGISKDLKKVIEEYSHGMKRKIQLVSAVCHVPDLLILDEPFRGLDPDAANILQNMMKDFVDSGRSILVATHDMYRAQEECDYVTILQHGRTLSKGKPSELINQQEVFSLEEYFLEKTGLRKKNLIQRNAIKNIF